MSVEGASRSQIMETLQPSPIRTDGSNSFARQTMESRLPTNIRNVAELNPALHAEHKQRITFLADAVAAGHLMPDVPDSWEDSADWTARARTHAGESWHDTEWLFAETYAYRLVLDAVRWNTGGIDPFASLKHREIPAALELIGDLEHSAASEADGAPGMEAAGAHELEALLTASLWGNRADVSFVAGGNLERESGSDDRIVVNHIPEAAEVLNAARGTVHMILDNAGTEVAADLFLAGIVSAGGRQVVLHAKHAPTYVSDATPKDILRLLGAAESSQGRTVRTWAAAFARLLQRGMITISAHPWWFLPDYWTQMPLDLATHLADSAMIIVKGDLNYRRVVRDSIWPDLVGPHTASGLRASGLKASGLRTAGYGASAPGPSASVLANTPILLLRTGKSDTLAPENSDRVKELDVSHPGWRHGGQYAVAQLIR